MAGDPRIVSLGQQFLDVKLALPVELSAKFDTVRGFPNGGFQLYQPFLDPAFRQQRFAFTKGALSGASRKG
jgi:hypothetical protein